MGTATNPEGLWPWPWPWSVVIPAPEERERRMRLSLRDAQGRDGPPGQAGFRLVAGPVYLCVPLVVGGKNVPSFWSFAKS